jgi:hypothetical protein
VHTKGNASQTAMASTGASFSYNIKKLTKIPLSATIRMLNAGVFSMDAARQVLKEDSDMDIILLCNGAKEIIK